METYGVSFDGFQPTCGWQMYRNVEEHMIPNLRSEVERYRKLRDKASEELAALKSLEADVTGLCKGREGLAAKLQRRTGADTTTLSDLITDGIAPAQSDESAIWKGLVSWLDESKSPIEQIASFYETTCARTEYALHFCEEYITEYGNAIRFWTQTLELERAHWVFEKAELKYKTKICREIVKSLSEYVGECRAQLGWLETGHDAEVLKDTPMREELEWLLRESTADLAYYRQIKSDIAEFGVEDAIARSSRKVTPPS